MPKRLLWIVLFLLATVPDPSGAAAGQSPSAIVPQHRSYIQICPYCPLGESCKFPDCPESLDGAAYLGPGKQLWPEGAEGKTQSNYAGSRLVSQNEDYYAQVDSKTCQFTVYKRTHTGSGQAMQFQSTVAWHTDQQVPTGSTSTCMFKLNSDGSFEESRFIPVNTFTRMQIWGLCQVGCVTGPFHAVLNDTNGNLEVHVGDSPEHDLGIWKILGSESAANNNYGHPAGSQPNSTMSTVIEVGIAVITGGTVWVP